MLNPHSLKSGFLPTLAILLMVLQLSACGTEEFLSGITPNIGTNTISDTSTETGTNNNGEPSNIALSWIAPSQREDNTAIQLSEIAGYKIFYGTTQGQYTNNITINDSTADGYTFNDFSAGTYYFVVTTIDTAGRESQYSSVISRTI